MIASVPSTRRATLGHAHCHRAVANSDCEGLATSSGKVHAPVTTSERTHHLTARVPSETVEALRVLAAREHRTLSAEVRMLIARRVESARTADRA